MPQCHARITSDDGRRKRCKRRFPHQAHTYCHNHWEEYVQATDAYKKVTNEAEALDIVFTELQTTVDVDACRVVEDLSADARVVETYVAPLETAIQRREEHHAIFFVQRTSPVPGSLRMAPGAS